MEIPTKAEVRKKARAFEKELQRLFNHNNKGQPYLSFTEAEALVDSIDAMESLRKAFTVSTN